MSTKRYEASLANFETRYTRWIAAQETGDPAELKAAETALPTLNVRLRAKLAAVDDDEPDPVMQALEKRALVLASEVMVYEAKRRRELRAAEDRRQERTIRTGRTVELPTKCVRCGVKLENPKSTGRPRLYCSPACRKAAHEDRRVNRDGAVKVQVVEKVVTVIRERRIEVPHPQVDCIQAVLDEDDVLVNVIWVLIDLIRDHDNRSFGTEQARFWDLYNNVEILHEALISRAEADQRPDSATSAIPMNRHGQHMQRMTFPRPPSETAAQ